MVYLGQEENSDLWINCMVRSNKQNLIITRPSSEHAHSDLAINRQANYHTHAPDPKHIIPTFFIAAHHTNLTQHKVRIHVR
jgi:hypothetical protein